MIRQKISFMCPAHLVFEALTDAKQFSRLTGTSADIHPTPGGRFSCFDGMITGMNIEILPGKRLVQAWRVADWEPGEYSLAKFELEAVSDAETMLTFTQTGFPEQHGPHLEQGWHEKYWKPMKAHLNA